MSLGTTLYEQVAQHRAEAAPPVIQAQSNGLRISLEAADVDRYSVALRRVMVAGFAAPTDQPRAYLSSTAAAIIRELSYLEEPLAVWELEGSEGRVDLRSAAPMRQGDALTYWEISLRSGDAPELLMARYRWAPGIVEREQLDYPATFGLVARIADSLEAALMPAEISAINR